MATEDELPKKLGKLEITPNLPPQIKAVGSSSPLQLNPFFDFELNGTEPENKVDPDSVTQSEHLNYTRPQNPYCRRCRFRRASESVLDEIKHSSSNAASDLVLCTSALKNGVSKQTLKKASPLGGYVTYRKLILREPVLKALQTCVHPHNNVRRKLLATAVNTKATANNEGPLEAKGISDFRDLIDECRNLLSEDVDFSGRLNQLSLNKRNSKNFTTMQIPNNKSRNNRSPKLNAAISSLPSPEKTSLTDDQFGGQAMTSMQQPPVTSSSIVQQRNSVLPTEQLTNPARCNTSCSQQAGNSAAAAAASDDVTIDELACYFETFVHIPKKMSSMAEMMYI